MFLEELLQEEKTAFLELAALIANIDGDVLLYEKQILNKYKKELGLLEYETKGLIIEDILDFFKSERSKMIVLTELFQLIFSDGVFHDQEKKSVQLIKKHFGFDKSQFADFKDWINKIKELSAPKKV